MAISLQLSEEEQRLFQDYANMHHMTLSEMIRKSVLACIEDEYDLAAYEKAMEEYRADQATYSLDEVERELGL